MRQNEEIEPLPETPASLTNNDAMTCIVCWEENLPRGEQQVLEPCRHSGCRKCIQDWIQTCEQQGHENAKCPHCRRVIADATCKAILGRPYQAKSLTAEDVSNDALDDFTLTWLQHSGAKPCPNCGAWLLNEDNNNEPIMCLCGYCYCFDCDACALDCNCGHDEFYDNATGQEMHISNIERLHVATEEDRHDFRAFLEARREAVHGASEPETIVEETAEADFVTIFDYEEDAEADFISILEWIEEEEEEEERSTATRLLASQKKSRGLAQPSELARDPSVAVDHPRAQAY